MQDTHHTLFPKDSSDSSPIPVPGRKRKSEKPGVLQGRKIIVADDNQDFQVLIKFILEAQGACVLGALNGFEAIALAETGQADALLMDIHMPAMDGYQAAKVLRDRGNTIPIVALSAGPVSCEGMDGPPLEFDSCLDKPLDFPRLFETIRLLAHPCSLLLCLLLLLPLSLAMAQDGNSQALDISVNASEIGISADQSGLDPVEVEALRQHLARRLQTSSFIAHGGQMRIHLSGLLLQRLQDSLGQVDLRDPRQVDDVVDRVLRDYEGKTWDGLDQTQFIIGRSLAAPVYESVRQLVVIGSEGEIEGDVERALIIGSRINFKPNSHVRQGLVAVGSQVATSEQALAGAQRVDVIFPSDSNTWFQSMADDVGKEWRREMDWFAWPASLYGRLIALVLSFAFGAFYLSLFPLFHRQADNLLMDQKAKTLGVGFLGYTALVLILALLAVTLVGILLMPSLLFGFAIFSAMGYFTAASTIGQRLLSRYPQHDIWKFSLGLLCLQVIGLVPWLGWALVQVAAMAGFGAVLLALFQRFRSRPLKRVGQSEAWVRPMGPVRRWRIRAGS